MLGSKCGSHMCCSRIGSNNGLAPTIIWTNDVVITSPAYVLATCWLKSLHWRHNEDDDVSNHRWLDCFLKRLFRSRSMKTSNPRVTGLCEGSSLVTNGFPSQRASNVKMFPFDDIITIFKFRLLPRWHRKVPGLVSFFFMPFCVCVCVFGFFVFFGIPAR